MLRKKLQKNICSQMKGKREISYIPSWFYKNQLGFFMPKFLYIAIPHKGVVIKFEKKGGSHYVKV